MVIRELPNPKTYGKQKVLLGLFVKVCSYNLKFGFTHGAVDGLQ
jgi:hypothetical protein